ncbi:MAG: helix-turn-helix transcriptional regulator [Luteimonas sp.]
MLESFAIPLQSQDLDGMPPATWLEHANGCEIQCDYTRAGLGQGQSWSFADGHSLISVTDFRANRALRGESRVMEDLLLVRAQVGGAISYAVSDASTWHFVRPAVTVSLLPRGTRLNIVAEPGVAQTTVTVLLRPRALIERFGLKRNDLPAPLLAAIDGMYSAPSTLMSLPLDRTIASLVDDLVRSRLQASLRGFQVAARGLELLLLTVVAWNEDRSAGEAPSQRSRDAELVAAARRILNQRLVDPPTLQQLAREIGTNRNKLNQIFRHSMGITLKAYCVQRRMERAQILLQEGCLNIAQIAEAVGYQHQSSFTAAFRDAMGMCPRDFGSTRREPAELDLALH